MERGHAFSILELLAVISLIIIMLAITLGIADGIRQIAANSRGVGGENTGPDDEE